MFLLSELSKFQTKKRSSEIVTWVAWSSMLAVALAVSALFSAIYLQTMRDSGIRYFNIRTANIDQLRSQPVPNEAFLTDSTPLFFLSPTHVIVGSIRSVVAPRPDNDVIMIPREQWQNRLAGELIKWKRVHEVFPSRVVAIASEVEGDAAGLLSVSQTVVRIATEVNRKGAGHGRGEDIPVPVFVSLGSTRLAQGSQHGSN